MRDWIKRTVVIGLLAAASFGVVGCGGGASGGDAGESEPLKIGAILSLTGTYAAMGSSEQQALDLEVKRINDAGGINGRRIEVLVEDDATDEAKAVAAATKLLDQEGVIAIIGATGTGQSMAIRESVKRAGVPQISMAGGTVITQDFDAQVFQTPWSNTIVVPFVLQAIKADGHSRIAVISDSGGYGKDGKAIIEAEAKKMGIEVVTSETFNAGDTDMTAQVTKAKGSGAQAVLLWTAGKEAASIMQTAKGLGMLDGSGKLPFYGGSGQARLEFPKGAGDAAEGFVFGTGKSLVPENWFAGTPEFETVSAFSDRYTTAYGEAPDIFAGHAYDALAIVADGLKRAGDDPDGPALRDAIEQTDGLIGMGGTFTFSKEDHNGLTTEDLSLYRIEGGKWVAEK